MSLGHRLKSLVSRTAVAFLIVLFTRTINAGPIVWSIDASFVDGGTLTGTFEFDTTQILPNSALSYSLTVTGGNTSVFPSFTYTPANSISGGGFSFSQLLVNDLANGRELDVFFSGTLLNPGSSPDPVATALSVEMLGGSQGRSFSSGIATVVPDPSAFLLLVFGLAYTVYYLSSGREPVRPRPCKLARWN